MGKKRKYELDLDAERTLYSSFVSAANSVSQLYTQGLQQQRKAAASAARQTLERVICFVLRECGDSQVVSKAVLLEFLQQEYQNVDVQEVNNTSIMQPVHLAPATTHNVVQPEDGTDPLDTFKGPRFPFALTSPPRRNQVPGCAAMDTQEGDGRAHMEIGHHGHTVSAPELSERKGLPDSSMVQYIHFT